MPGLMIDTDDVCLFVTEKCNSNCVMCPMSLASRMEVSKKIGEFKKAHNIAIVQAARWEDILSDMISKGQNYGLSPKFITDVFNAIHEASVAAQNRILEGD